MDFLVGFNSISAAEDSIISYFTEDESRVQKSKAFSPKVIY